MSDGTDDRALATDEGRAARDAMADASPSIETNEQTHEIPQYEDMQSLMDAADGGFRSLRRHQTVKGVVVSVTDEAILVDVGTKSEGFIPREELAEAGEEPPPLAYGQEVLVQVLEPEGPQGPVLSLKRAQRDQAWVDMQSYVTSGQVVSAPVVDHNRGGALLDVRGLRGFVPLSQLVSLAPSSQSEGDGEDTQDRLSRLHGQRLSVKVLEANREQNRLILSERAADQEQRAERRSELLAELKPGEIRHGRVRNVTSFGAFVDIGGADGLVHVSEMSYERIQNPRAILEPGQEVDVYVLDVNPEDQKIALSLKRAVADPWESIAERRQPGEVVEATITRLAKFGAFAQIEPGVEGLIHLTELADVTPTNPRQVVEEGQKVQAKIIHIDPIQRRLGLSLRQMASREVEMTPDEWAAEQERDAEPQPSAFETLSSIADTLPEAGPETATDEEVDSSPLVPDEPLSDTELPPAINQTSDGQEGSVDAASPPAEADQSDNDTTAYEQKSAGTDTVPDEEASAEAESDDVPEAINAVPHAT